MKGKGMICQKQYIRKEYVSILLKVKTMVYPMIKAWISFAILKRLKIQSVMMMILVVQ